MTWIICTVIATLGVIIAVGLVTTTWENITTKRVGGGR